MLLFWNYFVLSFSALLPLINPLGSALIFLTLVGQAPIPLYHSLARRIAVNPGPALRLTKKLMREGQHMRLDSLLELSAAFQALAHKTPQHEEAVAAFIEKRPPRFD